MTALNFREQMQARMRPAGSFGLAGTEPAAPEHIQLNAFYTAVLPDGGQYVLFQNKKQTFYPSLDAFIAATTERLDTQGLYFATAAYGPAKNRTAANVRLLRAHRVDIDAGEAKFKKHSGEGVYPDQSAAIAALLAAIKAGLPRPTLVVSSGEGLHVYWTLDADVAPAQWLPTAKLLGQACTHWGLMVDSTVTADTARILRPVGALHPNGKRVTVLRQTDATYTNDALAALLGQHLPELDSFELATLPLRATAATTKAKASNLNDDFLDIKGPPASLLRVATFCSAVRAMQDSGGNVPEPHWRAVIGVAKYCEDGEAVVHQWSAGYEGYDPHETQQKLERWETPPSTCQHFAQLHKGCADCKFSGKITTPKQLGYAAAELAGSVPAARVKAVLPDRRRRLDGTPGTPLDTTDNIAGIADALGCKLRYNLMARQAEISIPGLKSARDDLASAALTTLGDAVVRAGMNRGGLKELVDAVAGRNPFHPVLDWITSKPWDGTHRGSKLSETLELQNLDHRPLCASLLNAWCLQCIAALVQPEGVAAQGILVLAGPQDTNKTRWAASLAGQLPGAIRTGMHLDPVNKDSVFQATTCWVCELGELDHTTRRADVSALKAFLTRDEDILRRPYALVDNVYKRRTVFIGTVNGSGFLADTTGDRRFWVIAVKQCRLLSPEDMQQIWAEFLVCYEAGQRWHLDEGTKAALASANAAHRVVDPLQERIQTTFDWSKTRTPDWQLKVGVRWMTATDVCMQLGVQQKRSDSTRAGVILRGLNGGLVRRSNGATLLAVPPRGEQM